jgi:tetratricopeptide (TPR) repeat protein
MSDTRPSIDQLADTARLALARGDRDGARASLTSALQAVETGGTIGTETAESLLRLGAVYQDAGLDAEAERLFRDAVAIAESTLAEDDLGLAAALTCLGTRLLARGANDEAEPLLRRALDISEGQLGADHPDLNGLLNVLSRLYLKQGAFRKAEPLLDRLLALKRVKGEEHPEVATVLASLALVRQGVGDHEGAEMLGRRVLQIREKTLAPNHYAIASALELLGDECAARG